MEFDNVEKIVISVIGVIVLLTLSIVGYSIYKNVGKAGGDKKLTLQEIADRFNKSDRVKRYFSFGGEVVAIASENQIEIVALNRPKVTLTLDGEVLTYVFPVFLTKESSELLYKYESGWPVLSFVYEIFQDIQVFHGQDKEVVIATMNALSTKAYKIDVNNYEMAQSSDGKTITLKMNINKKMTLIDMKSEENSSITMDVLSSNAPIKGEDTNRILSPNQRIWAFVGDSKEEQTIIWIYDKDKKSDNAYKTLINIITSLYGEEESNKFKTNYKSFDVGNKKIGAYNIKVSDMIRYDDDFGLVKLYEIYIDKKAI